MTNQRFCFGFKTRLERLTLLLGHVKRKEKKKHNNNKIQFKCTFDYRYPVSSKRTETARYFLFFCCAVKTFYFLY